MDREHKASYARPVAELLPRFYRRLQEIEDMQKLGKILLEVDGEAHPDSTGTCGEHRRTDTTEIAGAVRRSSAKA